MISKKYIKDLEFKTIEDIFNYIIDSEINGAYSQFKELINKLSKQQFKDFLKYMNNFKYSYDEKTFNCLKDKVINARGF